MNRPSDVDADPVVDEQGIPLLCDIALPGIGPPYEVVDTDPPIVEPEDPHAQARRLMEMALHLQYGLDGAIDATTRRAVQQALQRVLDQLAQDLSDHIGAQLRERLPELMESLLQEQLGTVPPPG